MIRSLNLSYNQCMPRPVDIAEEKAANKLAEDKKKKKTVQEEEESSDSEDECVECTSMNTFTG